MRAYAIDFAASKALAFSSTQQANGFAVDDERYDVVTNSVDSLLSSSATMAQILSLHNALSDAKRATFVNKATAYEALLPLLEALPLEADVAIVTTALGQDGGVPPVRGRKPEFAGKRIFPSTRAALENTRRVGSVGYFAMEAVRAKPGLTFEEYCVAGGAGHYLKWDVARGHLIVKD